MILQRVRAAFAVREGDLTSRYEKPLMVASTTLTTTLMVLNYFFTNRDHTLPWLIMLILSSLMFAFAVVRVCNPWMR